MADRDAISNRSCRTLYPGVSAVKLFEDEYKVPILAPAVAARIAMINELTTSTLLFLGLATRVATLPLLGMISFIEIFVYPNAWPDHVLWDPR